MAATVHPALWAQQVPAQAPEFAAERLAEELAGSPVVTLGTGEVALVLVSAHEDGEPHLPVRVQVRIDIAVVWLDNRTLAVIHRPDLAQWLWSQRSRAQPVLPDLLVDDLQLSWTVIGRDAVLQVKIDAHRTYYATPASLAALALLLGRPAIVLDHHQNRDRDRP